MTQNKDRRKSRNAQHQPKNIPTVKAEVTNPKEVQSTQDQQEKTPDKQALRKGLLHGVDRASRYALFLTAVLLVLNILTLLHLKSESRLTNRAWIGLNTARHEQLVSGQIIRTQLDFINTGKTPAIAATVHYTLCWRPKEFDMHTWIAAHEQETWENAANRGPIAPNASFSLLAASDEPITESLTADILSGKTIVYVFGTISYNDIFYRPHQTKFCSVIRPSTERMQPYHEYNYMD